MFYVLFVCKCVLPPGDNPTAINKYIISRSVRLNHLILLFQWAYSVSVDNISILKDGVMIFWRVNWGFRREAFHSASFSVTDFTRRKENRDLPVCNEKPANKHLSKST